MGIMAAVGQMPHEPALHLGTCPHAAGAQNALVQVDANDWTWIAVGKMAGCSRPLGRNLDRIFAGPVQQLVVFGVTRGIVDIVAQEQL
jgi:hypothetical protein